MKTPLVRFQGISKTYDGRTHAVEGLDLDIAPGEFLTLLGPSGSGKTTSLMMLAGFEAPTRGEIFLDGGPISRLPAHRRGIGMVFQNYALFPHMSVAENLAFPLKARGKSRTEIAEKVSRALAMVRLEAMGARRPAQLSGGQQQRIAVARALVFEPRLILMDEPLGALDKSLREQMQFEIKRIHRELGVTIVYVTHDQGEALTMSDRIAVFNRGRIAQLADPRTLYDKPDNLFVANFVGEMNALRCTATSEAGECVRLNFERYEILGTAMPGGTHGVVTACIRPEHVLVEPDAAAVDIPRVRVTVSDVSFMGDHMRIAASSAGGAEFVARQNSGSCRIQRGDEIVLGLPPWHVRAFPGTPDSV
jgi:putative spermidine/putrescine transport system ATP-binding protein